MSAVSGWKVHIRPTMCRKRTGKLLDTFIQHALYGSTDGVERTPVNEKMKCVTVNVFAKTGTIAEIEGPSEIAQMQDCTLSLLHGRIGQNVQMTARSSAKSMCLHSAANQWKS